MKTILLLVDEGTLQGPLRGLLQRHGYRVLEAGDAQDALCLFLGDHLGIDLLVADVCLPVGSGIQVALTLRTYNPEIGVLLASNYPSETWKPRYYALLGSLGSDGVTILRKPLLPQTLLKEIANLIGEETAAVARIA